LRKKAEEINASRDKDKRNSDLEGTGQKPSPEFASTGDTRREDTEDAVPQRHTTPKTAGNPESNEARDGQPDPRSDRGDDQGRKGPDKHDDRLPEIEDFPIDASHEQLTFLRNEKDRLYKAQDEYYEAVRLKTNAMYQRRLNRYQQNVLRTKTNIRDQGRNKTSSPTNGRNDHGFNQTNEKRQRANAKQRGNGNDAAARNSEEELNTRDEDIEDRISLLHFEFPHRGREDLMEAEVILTLPYEIEMNEIHQHRHRKRYRDCDAAFLAQGRMVSSRR
jgi:hypothetical protein